MIDFRPVHSPTLIIIFFAAAVVMGAVHRRLSSSGSLLAILYCLPFTLMHELSHFVAALLTGGRPSSFSVWPRRSANGWILGSVSAVPTLLSAAPTALAPLGWLMIGYQSLALWEMRPAWLPEYLIVAVLYACTAASTPSWQDIKVALTHPFSLLLWTAIVSIVILLSRYPAQLLCVLH